MLGKGQKSKATAVLAPIGKRAMITPSSLDNINLRECLS
jgi:hypothetical protein